MGGTRGAGAGCGVSGGNLRSLAIVVVIVAMAAGVLALPAAAAGRKPRHATTTEAPTTTLAAPVPVPAPDPAPLGPGGTVTWSPAGRFVLGQPVMQFGSVGGAMVAWINPRVARPVVVPGTGDPGGPWPWGGQVEPGSRPLLVAAFNGGFKFGDFIGGIVAQGRSYRDLVAGQSAFVVYADGSFTLGEWGRDMTPSPNIVAVRQNLPLLVDGGAPVPSAANPGVWGGSVAGVATMRSALGVDANGALVWAGGRLSPLNLAGALIAAGAVRGMQMDINPDWVNFNLYQPQGDGSVVGVPVFGATGPNRYLSPDGRDFVAILVRGAVVPGASRTVGVPPINTSLTLPRR